MAKNPYLARHYLKISVQGNGGENNGEGCIRACSVYGAALISLGFEVYGMISVPGFSPVPKVMYWFHKAAASGCEGCGNPTCWKEEAKRSGEEFIDMIKSLSSKKCFYCFKMASVRCPGKLKHCARCSGAWYCGRKCQAAAWKAGHKLDCVKLSGPSEAALR